MSAVRVCAALGVAFLLQCAGLASAASFSISGFVWIDANGNRLPSVWEPKFPGATVQLMHPTTHAVLKTATTGASGSYAFLNVPKGAYRLGFMVPPGYSATTGPISLTLAANAVKNFGMTTPKSIEEKALNAFGDRWSLARPNPSLLRAAGTGCYRKPAPGMGQTFTPQELQFLKQQATRFYIEGCAVILETDPPFEKTDSIRNLHSSTQLKARIAQFKAAQRTGKYVGYQQVSEWNEGQVGWSEIYRDHKDWFVYKKGATTQTDEDIVRSKSRSRLLDITNPAYQDYVATRLAQALTYYNIDGLNIDLVSSVPRVPDLSLVPDSVRAGWGNGWVGILTKLKAALGPNKLLFASVQRDNIGFASAVVPVVDGIMLEDTFSPVRDDIMKRITMLAPAIDAAAAAGKWVLTTEITKVDGSTFATTTPAIEHVYARYYLAAFYIFSKGKMIYYHSFPTATAPQYGGEVFFTDWNIKVGGASGPYREIPGRAGVYKRNYGNAIVYLNTTATTYTITVPAASPFKFDPDGNPVTSYAMAPKSGFILSRAQAFQ